MSGWICYARVSTAEQAESGVSLGAQMEACRSYCSARSLPILHEITDPGISGATLERPGVQKALALLRSGKATGIVVWRLDRLTRSVKDLLGLVDLLGERSGLISVTEVIDTAHPMGRFVLTLLGAMAQWERETISVRAKASSARLKQGGHWTGSRLPAGLTWEPDGDRKRIILGPEADKVRPIWTLVLQGQSLADVAEYLEGAGIPQATGKPWSPVNVGNLLRSRFVTDRLVDERTQRAALAALKGRQVRRTGTIVTESPSLLAGLMRCPSCGSACVHVSAHGRTQKYHYLRCVQRAKRRCDQKDLPEAATENAVLAGLSDLLQRPLYRNAVMEYRDQAATKLDEALAEQKALSAKRAQLSQRIMDLALSDQVDRLAEALAVLGDQIKGVDKRLAELVGAVAAATIDQQTTSVVADEIAAGAASLLNQGRDQQRAFVQRVVEQVTIRSGMVVVHLYRPGFVPNSNLVPQQRTNTNRTVQLSVPVHPVENTVRIMPTGLAIDQRGRFSRAKP